MRKTKRDILDEVEEQIILDMNTESLFNFAKLILAKKYGVEIETVRKLLPSGFTNKLKSRFPHINKSSIDYLVKKYKR